MSSSPVTRRVFLGSSAATAAFFRLGCGNGDEIVGEASLPPINKIGPFHDPTKIGDYFNLAWQHYKKYRVGNDGQPLADPDTQNISGGSLGKELTFSETISYILFGAVLANDKQTFEKVWAWSYKNQWGPNVKQLYDYNNKKWVDAKNVKGSEFYGFYWRWTPNIAKTGTGGIIYQTAKAAGEATWRDGSDTAPDGDELIAGGALLLAHLKGWGKQSRSIPSGVPTVDDYYGSAAKIVGSIWDRSVLTLVPGTIDNFEAQSSVGSWFTFKESSSTLTTSRVKGFSGHALRLQVTSSSWGGGCGKTLGSADFSVADKIELMVKGKYKKAHVLMEDKNGLKLRAAIPDASVWTNVSFSKSTFQLDPYWGPNQGKDVKNFDWKSVKSQMIQIESGTIDIDNVRISGKNIPTTTSQHLVSNDKGEMWINVSYYMPWLFGLFAKVDPNLKHRWLDLKVSAYNDIKASKNLTLKDDKGNTRKGNGALPADWFSFDILGNPTGIPFENDANVDGWLSSWDGKRTDAFAAIDYLITGYSRAEQEYLRGSTYKFLREFLEKHGYLPSGFAIDGKLVPGYRDTDQETPFSNGIGLMFFHAAGDKKAEEYMFHKLQNMAKRDSDGNMYHGKKEDEYYRQFWALVGLAFANDKMVAGVKGLVKRL